MTVVHREFPLADWQSPGAATPSHEVDGAELDLSGIVADRLHRRPILSSPVTCRFIRGIKRSTTKTEGGVRMRPIMITAIVAVAVGVGRATVHAQS